MAVNDISNDEFAQFKSINRNLKIEAMEMYLIGNNGYKYNMQEVGKALFGDENYSFTVSLITRCYNFAGQNGGKYRNGCKFEKTYGYRVSREDIEAFVRKYPNGTFGNGVTFEDFLIARVESSRNRGSTQFNEEKSITVNGNSDGDGRDELIGCGFFSFIILVIMFFMGWLFKHWLISLFLISSVILGLISLKK